jgi:uncharacterized protein YkwD
MRIFMRKFVLVAGAAAVAAVAAIGSTIAIASAADDPSLYQAEGATSALTGGARIGDCAPCSGGQKVGWVGHSGVLTISGVTAAAAGPATITVAYTTAEQRNAALTVNEQQPVSLTFASTGGWDTPKSRDIPVTLNAGANTLTFANPAGWAPDFDSVRVSGAASPTPEPSASPTSGPVDPGDPVTAYEAQVFTIVNTERATAGCQPLNADSRLAKAARAHSADMAAKNYFSHTSLDGTQFADRITAAGYKWSGAGENIAKGQRTPADVMNSWMNSAGHRANILNCGYKDIGVGLAYDSQNTPLWTQDFGSPR